MLRHWFLLGAILTSFFYVFVPGVLWSLDKVFSKVLEQRLFVVKWHWIGVAVSVVLWVVWGLFCNTPHF